jgi:DNA-binding LytR/AlgR family response regulator
MDINSQIPRFLINKRNIVSLIIFTAAFALVFINVYAPFGVDVWFHVTKWQLFFYSSLVILTGVLVIVLSRIIMYHVGKKRKISYGLYAAWVLAEIAFMSLFYSLYVKFILHDTRYFPDLWKVSLQNTALVLLLPYSVSWLYFSYMDKKIKLAEFAQGQPVTDVSKQMVPFSDEKGVLRFSVKQENLLFIEASDNYVNIHYLNGDKVSRFMLRNSLRAMEETFKGSDIVRCHRSYMVNSEKVKVIRREKDGVRLELDAPSTMDIPVTKTYLENVMSAFSHVAPAGRE